MVRQVRFRWKARLGGTTEAAGTSHLIISSAMSANAITRRYPQTEQLFEQLHVDRWQEGYETVEELAWRHGVDVSQFIEQLQQAALKLPGEYVSQ